MVLTKLKLLPYNSPDIISTDTRFMSPKQPRISKYICRRKRKNKEVNRTSYNRKEEKHNFISRCFCPISLPRCMYIHLPAHTCINCKSTRKVSFIRIDGSYYGLVLFSDNKSSLRTKKTNMFLYVIIYLFINGYRNF